MVQDHLVKLIPFSDQSSWLVHNCLSLFPSRLLARSTAAQSSISLVRCTGQMGPAFCSGIVMLLIFLFELI